MEEGVVWTGNEELEALVTPIEKLLLDPENARRHSPRNLATIKSSLTLYGQQSNINVRKDGLVLKGNGTVMAALELGWTHIAVAVFNHDGSVAEHGYKTVDNRSGELADWEYGRLASSLKVVREGGLDLTMLGFEPFETDVIMQADFNPGEGGNIPDAVSGSHTVSFNDEAWQIIEQAVSAVRELAGDENVRVPRGVELLCADFLAGYRKKSEPDPEAE